MKKYTEKIELDPIEKADKAKELVIEKEDALHRIEDMKSQITILESRISEIDSELNSLLGLNKTEYTASSRSLKSTQSAIPRKGLVIDMAGVMSESDPMTINEIVNLLQKIESKKGDKGSVVMPNSIRSYLTNLDCFECIKKSDPGYSRKGWICHKEMLE